MIPNRKWSPDRKWSPLLSGEDSSYWITMSHLLSQQKVLIKLNTFNKYLPRLKKETVTTSWQEIPQILSIGYLVSTSEKDKGESFAYTYNIFNLIVPSFLFPWFCTFVMVSVSRAKARETNNLRPGPILAAFWRYVLKFQTNVRRMRIWMDLFFWKRSKERFLSKQINRDSFQCFYKVFYQGGA